MLRDVLKLEPRPETHRASLRLLGHAYQLGEGVAEDEKLAVEFFEQAADLGKGPGG